jgi:predicted secreted protein
MRWIILAVLGLLGITPAFAADAAQHRSLGYSPDGKYFAFEQFGIQDGSGFPYWDVFVLDLAANDWVKGTPARALVEDESGDLSLARKQAMEKAKPVLDGLKIGEPADVLVYNPATEFLGDRTKVEFGAFPQMPQAYELSVKAIELPVPPDCTDPDFRPMGMELTLKVNQPGKTLTLAKDTSIPKSRFCPLRYDIEAIYTRSGYGDGMEVAIIGVYARGFEGENRRFIAVPFTLPDWQ